MRIKLTAVGLVLLVTGMATAASAQSLTASLPGMMGGTGITPNGTGFDGTMGDPDLFPGPAAATPAGTLAPVYGAPGTAAGRGYAPTPPAMQYNFGNPYAR